VSHHVPDDLLKAFVAGDVDEPKAVEIAEHLDCCDSCCALAADLDPLAAAFAAVQDPEPPPGLVEEVLAAYHRPQRTPVLEIVLGGGLLAAAASLMVVFGDPVQAAVRVGVLVDALGTAGSQIALAGSNSLFALSLIALVLAGLSMAAARPPRLAIERRLS
jgi:predicted anti-sigma-YlaC factor YlaD